MLGFGKRITGMKSIISMIPTMFFEGEDGAVGSAAVVADPAPAKDVVTDVFGSNSGVPKEFLQASIDNDPDFQEVLEFEKETKKSDKNKKPEDHSDETENADDKNADDQESERDGDEPKAETTPDDKNSGEEEEFEFADDVIKGLKGEHLKAIPREAQLAIADFHTQAAEIQKERDTLKETLEALESDPVVRLRKELKNQGTDVFDVRGITNKEKAALTEKLVNFGLNQEEAEKVFSMFDETINAVAKEKAEDILHNRAIEEENRRKTDETLTNGRNLFLKLGQFNDALKFKETDGNKFWTKTSDGQWAPNEKHPEYKKFAEKVLPVMEALGKAGIKYGTLINLEKEIGIDGIYAMLAKKHGLPVAINTGERDKKMLRSELKKRMGALVNSKEDLESGAGRSKLDRSPVIKEGLDIVKLATDPTYYESTVDSKWGDLKWAKRVDELAQEGKAYVEKNKIKT